MFSTNREIHSINAADPYPEITYGDEEVEGSSSDAEPLIGDSGEVKSKSKHMERRNLADLEIQFSLSDEGAFPKKRHVLGLLGFFGFANVYAMRVNLSVAIVAMVNNTAPPDANVSDVCPSSPVPPDYIPVS
jgi:hypothetical protein